MGNQNLKKGREREREREWGRARALEWGREKERHREGGGTERGSEIREYFDVSCISDTVYARSQCLIPWTKCQIKQLKGLQGALLYSPFISWRWESIINMNKIFPQIVSFWSSQSQSMLWPVRARENWKGDAQRLFERGLKGKLLNWLSLGKNSSERKPAFEYINNELTLFNI